MLIKELVLENYKCYYDVKPFHFTTGLNFIIGGNTEGKTKFFEAFEWILASEIGANDLVNLASAKKIAEVRPGERFTVSVSLTVDHFHFTKTVKKSFIVLKEDTRLIASDVKYEGYVDNGTERIPDDGKKLLEEIFPTKLRKYSLFKGETDLHIFENKDALTNLINTYSSATNYSDYIKYVEYTYDAFEENLRLETNRDNRHTSQLNRLEIDLKEHKSKKKRQQVLLNEESETIFQLEKNIKAVENSQENAELIEELNKKIQNKKIERDRLFYEINENYNNDLFDHYWILQKIKPFVSKFGDEIDELTKVKRRLEAEFIYEQAKEEVQSNPFNYLPLPIDLPSKNIMEEMMEEYMCKFCDRSFEEEDKTHQYMKKRYEAFLESIQPKSEEESEPLFQNNYLRRMDLLKEDISRHLNGLAIDKDIRDIFEFNNIRHEKILNLELEIKELERKKDNEISMSPFGEDSLLDNFKNYKVWSKDIRNRQTRVDGLKRDSNDFDNEILRIENEINKIESKTATANASFLRFAKDLMGDVAIVFKQTKQVKFIEFIEKLENKSNEKFEIINSIGFTGKIKLNLKYVGDRPVIDINLISGIHIVDESTSAKTSMYLSVLLAISELTKETHSIKYPLIMDAPVSSFDPNKRRRLWEILNDIEDTQIIIAMYEFIDDSNEEEEPLINMEEFKKVPKNNGLFIKIERPFDKNDLETINTKVYTL